MSGKEIRVRDELRQNILCFVDSHAEEQLQFLIKLCNQNSYTYNKTGTDRVAEMILDRLKGLFTFHRAVDQNEVGDHHLLRNTTSSKAIYLLGHLDTVFHPDHPFQQCTLMGNRLKGPGTGDMKGGLAVIVYAFKALNDAGFFEKLPLVFIMSGDEEVGSITSRSVYLDERKKAVACLVAECAGPHGEVVVSRNGKMGARIDCYGQDRHVGNGTHKKASAILELAQKVVAVESLNDSLSGVSINVGKVEGGLGPCTIPAHACCLVDIRWVEEAHREIILDQIQTEVSRIHQTGCISELHVLNLRPAMPLMEGSEELFGMIREVGYSIGQEIQKTHRRGTSDANFFGSIGIPTIDGLGPVCRKDHTPDEFIEISSLKERTALLALFLAYYGKRSGIMK